MAKLNSFLRILLAAVVLLALPSAFAQSTNNTTTLAQVRLYLKNNSPATDLRLTRSVAQNLLSIDLFAACHAAVPVVYNNGSTAWNLIVCTDPAWNRLMYGDYNDWVKTYGSWGSGNGQFRHPQGIDRDAYGKVYVADTGNNRIVVLQINWQVSGASTYNTNLSYVESIGSLSIPEDVAWDDNGTPTNTSDDYVWVTDTGNHRIIRYNRIAPGYYFGLTYGTYGSGTGQFRNPRSIAVGRTSGVNDNNIYVADAGNQRIVRLNDGASGITWVNSRAGNMVGYSSVATDWYGGVWVTDDFNHRIEKLDRYLNFLDSYGSYGMGQVYGLLNAPTDFSIYFSLEKISGVDTWVGHDATFLSESWGDNSGGVCYEMGTDVKSIGVDIQPCPPPPPPDGPLQKINRPQICPTYCTYFLTDYSKVTLTVHKLSDNSLIRTLFSNQTKAYGQYSEYWDGKNNQGTIVPYAQYYFKISANSLYAGSSLITKTSSSFWLKASEPPEPTKNIPTAYALLPNYPNPFNPQTLIKYHVPASSRVKISIFDLLGRQIRTLVDQPQEAGAYRVLWNGLNERGQEVESGIYFYHMEAGDFVATRKMTLLR